MATTKFKFRASSIVGKEGTLFIQVIHRRVTRQVSTSYKLFPEEWDAVRQTVMCSPETRPLRSSYLRRIQDMLRKDRSHLQSLILDLDHGRREYQSEEVIRQFMRKEPSGDFLAFAAHLVGRKREERRISLATKYQASLNSLKRFLGDRPLSFDEMDTTLVLGYEAFLKKRGLCPNTTSFYMRNLRAIYNQAVEQGLTPQRHPFSHVYTGIAKTVKRAVTAEEVRQLKALDLPPDSAEAQSRDLFLFSLYTCGMSLIDVANLKKSDLREGYLDYCRQKTGQRILIRWEPCMQQLVDKYAKGDSPYLLPLIIRPGHEEVRQYQNRLHVINRYLKKLGKRLSFSSKLTSYVARHSWASIAKSQQVPLSAISEAMGHTSERTTRIYLKSFENSAVDQANRKVLSVIA